MLRLIFRVRLDDLCVRGLEVLATWRLDLDKWALRSRSAVRCSAERSLARTAGTRCAVHVGTA